MEAHSSPSVTASEMPYAMAEKGVHLVRVRARVRGEGEGEGEGRAEGEGVSTQR